MTSPLDILEHHISQISVNAKSSNDLVEVSRNAGKVTVKIKPGTFSALRTEKAVATEIASALGAALRQHRAVARKLRRDILGADI